MISAIILGGYKFVQKKPKEVFILGDGNGFGISREENEENQDV